MKPTIYTIGAFILLLGVNTACSADAQQPRPTPVDAAFLSAQGIPVPNKLVSAQKISDKEGEHLLVLSRQTGPSPSAPRSGRIEHIELLAALFTRRGEGTWKQDWTIRDTNDCPNLDASADFFVSELAFSDVDKDGRVEVAVPYYMQCAGGIEPRTVKVILREGQTKYAIRGESEVRYPGQEPFGGEHQHDRALLAPANAPFKRHLDAVWNRVYVDKR